MPSTYTSSTTPTSQSAQATSSSSSNSAPKNTTGVAVGATFGILAALIIVGVLFGLWRIRRKRSAESEDGLHPSRRRSTVLDRSHPAAKITPFGSPGGEMPRYSFAHAPGSNMRVAHRGMNGAWHFTDPQTPFSAAGLSDLDLVTPPSPSTASSYSRTTHRTKEKEGRVKGRTLGYLEMDHFDVVPPPPAYSEEHGSS